MVGETIQPNGTKVDGIRRAAAEPIAVVGMSCRLPQAGDPDTFWRHLRAGVDAVTEVPEGRWPHLGVLGEPEYRRGGFIADVDRFDADFFGISPNEAAVMDPQQRLALELAWEALENARLAPTALRQTAAGVYFGAISQDYAAMQDRVGAPGPHSYTGANRAMIANRVSYFLGLAGPSLTLDTGQSSSLVAVQLACESLRRGEIELALAGGVNLNLLAETTDAIGSFGALSPDGRCYAFDSRANGYVRGEGGALVVLKPLSAALRDGDVVHCVILGGAVNNDGGGDGLTAPNGSAQRQVIEAACAHAGVRPADVQYVELHGTGTRVGDPVEAAALGAALGEGRPAPLLVGSVKTNIGHLEGAAGIAGLLKVVLSIKHGELPPSLNFQTPNPNIPLDDLGLRVAATAQPWPRPDATLVAGVSSFGMGGTNCHLVLAAAPASADEPSGSGRPDAPWVLTARSAPALSALAERLRARIGEGSLDSADVALSLVRTRAEFDHRAVLLGDDLPSKVEALSALAAGRQDMSVVTGTATPARCAFTFPGQGSQWPEMARALLDSSPEFAERVAECDAALAPFVDYSLTDVLRGAGPDLDRVDVVQPALWAVMVSLAHLWRSHGVEPDLVIGHSQGEIAAATAVGALSISDGARVVALRSQAIAAIAGSGGMMSVAAPLDVVESVVAAHAPRATVAAVNGPASVVVSGDREVLAELGRIFDADYRTKIVPVDYASHSVAVEELRERLLVALEPIRPVSVDTLFISTLTGEPMDTAGLDAGYWYRSLRQPVRFADAVRRALDHGCDLVIECSPHPVLVAGVEETAEEAERDTVVVGTLRRADGGFDRFQRALAEAYTAGAPVDWAGTLDSARIVDLPTYPFQRQRHWSAEASPRPLVANGQTRSVEEPVRGAAHSRRSLRDLVLSTTAGVLGHQDAASVLPSRTFKELGVDSATAVELRNRLRAATGLRLSTGLLFDHPTPDAVVDHLTSLSDNDKQAVVITASQPADDDPVVIVAMGCRYPGEVTTPEDLWRLVATDTDAISEFPTNRGWDVEALFATGAERSGTSDTRHGGFLHDADQFDAGLFGISPREAMAMDPQQRVLLEICWETIERAGLDHALLRGSDTGVFIGAMAPDYGPRLHQPVGDVDGHLLTGNALSVVSGRIAYTLGLQGPALTIDTACSASLVAVHLAAQALRRGECSLALAGGATVMSTPGMFVEFSRQGGLAEDGRCKAFSSAADGTGWAEGAGVLLLERLSDARQHGHPVLAVLRGSAVNQDGRSNGMTAPNGPSQERVIRQALADARLDPADIDAVEAHGTGTRLGDPIEAQALHDTYGRDRPQDRPLWLGSLKSNIGHTQAAAGVAGVIKMVKALEHRVLPRTLHVDTPTEHVDWAGGGIRLLTEPVDLPGDRPSRAAVSSFGISGTNAHVILERAPEATTEPTTAPGPLVWTLSAKTEAALRAQAARLCDYAVTAPESDLPAAGHVLSRRARFDRRAVVVAEDRDDLTAALAALAEGLPHQSVVDGVAAADVRPVFVFPGQGSQWAGMATELLDTDAVFRDELTKCDEALGKYTGWSVLAVLRGDEDAPDLAGSDVIQPVLFAVMVSIAAVWRSVGIEPAAVVGHSQGEITAACAAGALSLDDAAKIVALRSQALMKLTGTGGMLAVSLPADEAGRRIEPWADQLWIAILSGPSSTVVAGDLTALDEFAAICTDVRVHKVAIDYAAHTPHIEVLREELLTALDVVKPRPSDIAFCSAMEGTFIDAADLTADYWYGGLRNPVRFADAVRAFAGQGTPLFIESSPHAVLTGHIQDTLSAADSAGTAIGSLRRGDGGRRRFLLAAAQAHVLGADVDWSAALADVPRRHVDLPTYPFEHRRYWIEGAAPTADLAASGMAESRHPLLGAVVSLAEGDGFLLTGRLSVAALPWLADHAVDGQVLLPGTAFVELALEAATVCGCDEIADLTLESPVVLPETGAVQLQVVVGGADTSGRRGLTVHTRPSEPADDLNDTASWTRHATGVLAVAAPTPADVLVWPPADGVAVDLDEAYERLADRGYAYGPAFQGLVDAWRVSTDGGTDTYVEVALPDSVRGDADSFTLHPALLDAALHVIVLGDPAHALMDQGSLLLPFSWSGVRVSAVGARALRVRITETAGDRVSLAIHDDAGQPIADVDALTLRPVERQGAAAPARSGVAPYAIDWIDLTVTEAPADTRRWAVVGSDSAADNLSATLGLAGIDAPLYYDLSSLAEITAGEVPDTIVVSSLSDVDGVVADLAYSAREGMYQVLDLIQVFLGDERFSGSRLLFVTRGVFAGSAEGVAGAPLWGLVRSAAAEHPGRFALVDVDEGCTEWAAVAAAVATGETQLMVRDADVLIPRLTRRGTTAGVSTMDASGTVLVTGGTGGLGALVAEHLVKQHGVRHLLLASRRGTAAPGAEDLVTRLCDLGAEVDVAACDVSDRYAVADLLNSIPADRPLTGIVHTAGVLDDATVDGLSAGRLDTVFAPKADAAWHLHELTRDLPLSTFVLFSSVAGVVGTPGQGNYAAANMFLDGLAARRHDLGLPAVSVAWGLWDTEAGMTGGLTAADTARLARSGIAPLTPRQGLDLLDHALSSPDPQVVAAKWDTAGLRQRGETGELPAVLRGLVRVTRKAAATTTAANAVATPVDGLAQRLSSMAEADARKVMTQLVRSHVAAVLAHPSGDAVAVDIEFSEMGFDSLTAVELRNRLDAEVGVRLPATVAFDHPTVAALAEFLRTTIAPSAQSPEDLLRTTLDHIHGVLSDDDENTRTKLAAILHSTLHRLGSGQASRTDDVPLDDTVLDQVDSASDEEMFAFIDQKF